MGSIVPEGRADVAARVIAVLLCSAPLFMLTIRSWSNVVLFAGTLMCSAFLLLVRRPPQGEADANRRFVRAMVLAMMAPIAAVAISSLFQGRLHLPRFDSPLRALLAIPILLFVIRVRFDAARVLWFVLPAALAVTLAHQNLVNQQHRWGEQRWSTYFTDPLVFGYHSLAFGLMCLMSIGVRDRAGPRWLLAAKIAGTAIGVYLSIKSGSRTGWLAVPIVLALWLHMNWGNAQRWTRLAVLAAAVAASAAAYWLSETVQSRVDLAIGELLRYPWAGGVAQETSVGLRVTFLRIANDLFFAHPWAGVGDTKQLPMVLAAYPYASPAALNTAYQSGFHNEIITNAVRSGVSGLAASLALFAVPLAVFARHLRSIDAVARSNAAIGIAFVTCIVVSSFTTEVLDLKYTASFYAVMVALLCGATLARHGQE